MLILWTFYVQAAVVKGKEERHLKLACWKMAHVTMVHAENRNWFPVADNAKPGCVQAKARSKEKGSLAAAPT